MLIHFQQLFYMVLPPLSQDVQRNLPRRFMVPLSCLTAIDARQTCVKIQMNFPRTGAHSRQSWWWGERTPWFGVQLANKTYYNKNYSYKTTKTPDYPITPHGCRQVTRGRIAALAASRKIHSHIRHQQQQEPHHVLRCCRRDQRPSAPIIITGQIAWQLTCFSRPVPKELPRPDSHTDLWRPPFE